MSYRKYRFVEDVFDPLTGDPMLSDVSPMLVKTKFFGNRLLHRIVRIIPTVEESGGKKYVVEKTGERGGWIESESNLSQIGNSWVGGDAIVWDSATVADDAVVSGSAEVGDGARILDSATVSGSAGVGGNSYVYGAASISGNARLAVFGHARVGGKVSGNGKVAGKSVVFSHGSVDGEGKVGGRACIYGLSLGGRYLENHMSWEMLSLHPRGMFRIQPFLIWAL